MATQVATHVDWDTVRERVKRQWGLVTDRDLSEANENIPILVGIIQRRTGRSREEIEHYMNQFVEDATPAFGRVRAAASRSTADTSRAFEGGYRQMTSGISDCLQTTGEQVRQWPLASVVSAFGLGVLSGVLIGTAACRR